MEPIATPSLTDRCSTTLGEMRAELAAYGTRRGPRAMLLAALVSLFETLLALIIDFKAGRLAPPPQSSPAGAEEGAEAPAPSRPAAAPKPDIRNPAGEVRPKRALPAAGGNAAPAAVHDSPKARRDSPRLAPSRTPAMAMRFATHTPTLPCAVAAHQPEIFKNRELRAGFGAPILLRYRHIIDTPRLPRDAAGGMRGK